MEEQIRNPVVRLEVALSYIKIYFNDTLHLLLRRDPIVGIQSYKNGYLSFRIDYHLRDGSTVETEYDKRETWEAVLQALDKIAQLF